jgi:NADH:ubiquinone oxidoreductase subunit 6 (subunit J)
MNPTVTAAPSLFSVDGMVGVIFLLIIAITLIGAFIACNSERLVRGIAGLIVCFIGVASLYYYLNSPFVAMMQILIYVGAVAVAISFAIMLAAPEESKKIGPGGTLIGPLGIGTAFLLATGLSVFAIRTHWPVAAKINDGSVKTIGIQLLTDYSLVFELISIVLLIAILGALVLARGGREG